MYKNILVPVSLDEDRNTAGALEIAQALGDDDTAITLLHVIEDIPPYVALQIPADVPEKTRNSAKAELSHLVKGLPNAKAVVTNGHSGRTILSWAKDHSPDCIVIAGHRPGMQDLLLGSTATQVVRHARCAVHVLR